MSFTRYPDAWNETIVETSDTKIDSGEFEVVLFLASGYFIKDIFDQTFKKDG